MLVSVLDYEPCEDGWRKKTGIANWQVKHLWSTNNRDQGSNDSQVNTGHLMCTTHCSKQFTEITSSELPNSWWVK